MSYKRNELDAALAAFGQAAGLEDPADRAITAYHLAAALLEAYPEALADAQRDDAIEGRFA